MKWLGLIEFFVVLAFALVWVALELFTRRLDRLRDERLARGDDLDPPRKSDPVN